MDIRNGGEAFVTNGGEMTSQNKRKRKCAAADDKNVENHHPSKRANTRRDNNAQPGTSASFATASTSQSFDQPGHSRNATTTTTQHPYSHHHHPSTQQHQLHHNSNHLHPPSVPSHSELSSDSSAPPSDFDLVSPQSIASILSPIAESVASPAPVKKPAQQSPLATKKQKSAQLKLVTPAEKLLCCITPSVDQRLCPLPALSWAEAGDVWKLMCRKDERASLERNSLMLKNHPGIQPRMRAILLDWLIEVCEVYKLHRETYYLAVDYLDRYLSTNVKISKTRLQLIGITCLFVAAKVEEIYPPKIGEFAYVTDGACQEDDIIQQELILLTALKWSISPVTIIGWLSVYMQLNCSNRTPKSLNSLVNSSNSGSNSSSNNSSSSSNVVSGSSKVRPPMYVVADPNGRGSGEAFVYPQFSGMEFVQAARLIDLCTLDLGLANFPYSVIAASAICFTINRSTALRVSGLEWGVLAPCVKWMEPFYVTLAEETTQVFLLEQNEQVKQAYGLTHICPNITTDDSHIIQTHSTSLILFESAQIRQETMLEAAILAAKQEASPAQNIPIHSCPAGLLTPPASNRKFPDANRLEPTPDPEQQPPPTRY